LTELGIWFVLWMGIPVAVAMFPISRLTLKREGWVLTRRVWYSLCVWYICMDFLVVIGGLTWHGWMLSVLYLIGVASWVGIATNRQRKPGPHPPHPMGTPLAGVDDFQQLLNKRRQAYAKMVQP